MVADLDGKALADDLFDDLEDAVGRLVDAGVRPGLATVHMGDDPAAATYMEMKQRECDRLGIDGKHYDVDSDAPEERLHETIADLNDDPDVHGVIVEDDVPDHVDWSTVVQRLDPVKDVEGVHAENAGRLVAGDPRYVPPTPRGIRELLATEGIETEGAHVVIVNRSDIVGKPLANLLVQKAEFGNATVTVCHTRTRDLAEKTRRADILVVNVATPGFVDESMVTPGTTIVDVGANRVDADTEKGYEVVGDVEYDSVADEVDAITPVPGGVGPMSRVMLHYNTVVAAQLQTDVELDDFAPTARFRA